MMPSERESEHDENRREQLRQAAVDILVGREKVTYDPNQYNHLKLGVAEVLLPGWARNPVFPQELDTQSFLPKTESSFERSSTSSTETD